ncbi:carbamoyltransferase [Photorhabdus tasmaniensis]|uniref:Carbamoyltransferase n=1 Tax=Photorhabdus tasmaniensis TaxID=1004159 RepID=A0ABX0GIZ4_9GAMM|nr:carbamoyltransferase C-terminal domain-containing protein [Photorhabdus tasmaniensis]NHB89170.1 hypothetical protein [Photorhabdus tasmaniensis]
MNTHALTLLVGLDMIILGINSFFEHPSVALLKDGKLLYAIEDERITRIKHGKSYTPYKTYVPFDSIYAALKYTGIHSSEIDEVAYSYSSKLHYKQLINCFLGKRRSSFREEYAAYRSVKNFKLALQGNFELPSRYSDLLPVNGFNNAVYIEWDHHLTHAASAFYYSKMESALIVVSDGSGEKSCTSIYIGMGSSIKLLGSIDLPNSLGFFYSDFTKYLGFEPFSDEYKVMGLAAYGIQKYDEEISRVLELLPNGRYRVNYNNIKLIREIVPPRKYGGELNQKHFDLACSVQRKLEQCLESIVRHYIKVSGEKNLCLAGGTFLNVLVNDHLRRLDCVKDIYIQPGAHDAGTALGAAALSWVEKGGDAQIDYDSMFLGSKYTESEILSAIELARVKVQKIDDEKLPVVLAELLANENIVALYRGRIEFGPRALGNRSLLASPRSAKTREKLNILKDREMFRPLAPLIPVEHFDTYFDGVPNRYMMMTARAKNNAKELIPAVVHVDGTSRVQAIYKKHDSFLHDVLTIFMEKTGVPILINTSFNVRGKPIDLTPYDALASFFTVGVDYLLMDNYLIKNPSLTSE